MKNKQSNIDVSIKYNEKEMSEFWEDMEVLARGAVYLEEPVRLTGDKEKDRKTLKEMFFKDNSKSKEKIPENAFFEKTCYSSGLNEFGLKEFSAEQKKELIVKKSDFTEYWGEDIEVSVQMFLAGETQSHE